MAGQKSRRKSREAALRALYEIELGHAPIDVALAGAADEFALSDEPREYAERLVVGVCREGAALDSRVGPLILDYDFERLAAIDRNILRLSSFELLHEPSVPPAVVINEAVELAKKYSTAESGKFVNGVLGKLLASSMV